MHPTIEHVLFSLRAYARCWHYDRVYHDAIVNAIDTLRKMDGVDRATIEQVANSLRKQSVGEIVLAQQLDSIFND